MTVEGLMAQYGQSVRNRVAGIIGDEDADDVCQLVWVSVWRNLDAFRGDAAITSWLYRIATNQAISYLRSRQRRGFVVTLIADDDEPVMPAPFVDQRPTPDVQFLSRREYAEVCDRASRRLNPVLRSALASTAVGETDREVAARLGIPLSTAKSRRFRARERLGSRSRCA